LPRITSAITDTIQAAENSQTTTAPIHHHMVASPPFQEQLFVSQAFVDADASASSKSVIHRPGFPAH
jgi:hypothetical protein